MEKIRMRRECLEPWPRGHPTRYISLNNLASGLSAQYDRSGSLDDLKEMLQMRRGCLERPSTWPSAS